MGTDTAGAGGPEEFTEMAEITDSPFEQTGSNSFTASAQGQSEIELPEGLSVADAEFQADGQDVVLTFPDGTTVTIEDYYSQPEPPKLTSGDGGEVSGQIVQQLTGGGTEAADAAAAPAPANDPLGLFGGDAGGGDLADSPTAISGTDGEPIGNVQNIEGTVWAVRADGTRVQLSQGDQVFQGDILESAEDGVVGILLADETTFSMSENGRMVLDEMIYDPSTQEGSVSMSVLEGVFTFVSGQVAKTDPDAMTLDTPVATIGIRGTQVGLDLTGGEMNVVLMEELGGFVGEVVIFNDGGVKVMNGANQFSVVTSFDSSPSDPNDFDVGALVGTFGSTLRNLPTRDADGNETSGNTYGLGDAPGDQSSAEDLADFETAAGEPEAAPQETIQVVASDGDDGYKVVKPLETPPPPPPPVAPTAAPSESGSDDDDDSPPIATEAAAPSGPPTFTGTEGDDTLTGTEAGDIMSGLGGNDVMSGLGGDDVMDGGSGNDTVLGGAGNDRITGGTGDDVVDGGTGDDVVQGGAGADQVSGGTGNDRLYAGSATAGTLAVNADGSLSLVGGTGESQETRTGDAVDVLQGGDGNDQLIGSSAADRLDGGTGNDLLYGGGGDDNLVGGDGNDILDGGAGNDSLDGGAGNDVLIGGAGSDQVVGGAGDDRLVVGVDGGLDTFEGGEGEDTLDLSGIGADADLVVDLSTMDDAGGLGSILAGETLIGTVSGVENVIGSAGDDVITGSAGANVITGGAGDDMLDGGGGQDTATFNGSFAGYQFSVVNGVIQLTGEDGTDTLADIETLTFEDDPAIAVGFEDTAVSLDVAGLLPEASGAERYVFSNVPSGAEFSAGTPNSDGSWTVTAEQLDGLTITPPDDSNEDFTLTVDAFAAGETETPLASADYDVNVVGLVDPFSFSINGVDIAAEGFDPSQPIQITGAEDQLIPVPIVPELSDLDGSEVMTVEISGLPLGETNPDGTHTGGATLYVGNPPEALPRSADGTYTIDAADLGSVFVKPAENDHDDFDLDIKVTVTESDGATSTAFGSVNVDVKAVADAPAIAAPEALAGLEDTAIELPVQIATTDPSESITSITLSGVPTGATVEIMSPEGLVTPLPVQDGVVNIPAGFMSEDGSLPGLKVTPPADSNVDFNLELAVTSSEPTGSGADASFESATTTLTIPVDVTGVADEIGVEIEGADASQGGTTAALSGTEDTGIPLDISASLSDTDTSETLSITIEGVPENATLSAGTDLGGGTYSLTPEQLEGLVLQPAPDSDENFTLTVTTTATENDGDVRSVENYIAVDVGAVADTPELSAQASAGDEDTAIALDVSAALTDTDGSESLSLTISGLPEGAALSHGSDNGDGSWTISAEDFEADPTLLDSLALTPPENFSGDIGLTVTATATEAASGESASTSVPLDVTVDPVADQAELSVGDATGSEDTAIPLDITAVSPDDSEVVSVTIEGVPEGATLSGGTHVGNGTWVLNADDVAHLTITPPTDSDADFDLTVTATTNDGGEISEGVTETLHVNVEAVADDPELNTQHATAFEGDAIPLNIEASLTDTDGSEELSITISDIPDGAVLFSGDDVVGVTDGTAVLTQDQLTDLRIVPAAGQDDFSLNVTATATEGIGGDAATVSGTINIDLQEQADAPTLILFDAAGHEDTAIPLNIHAALTDPGEVLGVTISNIPDGATLTVGGEPIAVVDGVAELTPEQLSGLTITPPEHSSEDMDLLVTATSTTQPQDGTGDGTPTDPGGNVAVTTAHLNIAVAGVADTPALNLGETTDAVAGTPVPLDIDASLVDTDGSETLTVTISNLPEGATLNNGSQNEDGSWTLSAGDLAGLTITAPASFEGPATLFVTATATENDGDVATFSDVLNMDFADGQADAPTLIIGDAEGLEDTQVPLNIDAALNDEGETLSVTISGVPDNASLTAGTNLGNGVWELTPDQLDGLKLNPPADSNVDFDLTVTATSQLEGTTEIAEVTQTLHVDMTGVADTPVLNVELGDQQVTDGGSAFALDITSALTDTDGSEELTVTVSGLPEDVTLSAGTVNEDGSVTLTAEDMQGLQVLVPDGVDPNFDLTVTSTAAENDGDIATAAHSISVIGVPTGGGGDGEAQTPYMELSDTAGLEDTGIPLDITAFLTDQDGSETLSLTISGLNGATLNNGTPNEDGSVTLTEADLEGLVLTPSEDSNVDLELTVTATSRETSTGDTATVSGTLNVDLTGVADAPSLGAAVGTPTVADDGVNYPLNIASELTDTDGSEALTVTVQGLPDGVTLSAGTVNDDGSVSLTPQQLAGLTMFVPNGIDPDFDFDVVATSTENDGDVASVSETIVVDGDAEAETPDLDVSAASGDEDSDIPLDIAAALTDTDGSESLTVTITGVPDEATLSAGSKGDDGSWTLDAADLEGLSIRPPADSNVDFTLNVTATSTEAMSGATASQSATLNVAVAGVADAPTLTAALGEPTDNSGVDITLTNVGSTDVGYHNTYGYYLTDADGNPVEGGIIWTDMKDSVGDSATLEGVDPDSIGYFVIPNGDSLNPGLADGDSITFRQSDDGAWIAVGPDGQDLDGQGAPVLFDEPALNPDGFDYTTDNGVPGNQNWEDLFGGGDHDYDDVNVQVESAPGSGDATVSYPLTITSALTDTDGSEELTVTVSGLPDGATLSAGTVNEEDGSVSLTPAQLAGLTLTVPAAADDFDLTVTSTATENDGHSTSVDTTLTVDMPDDTTAEAPELTLSDAAGAEDTAIPLDISAVLPDDDGSETLSVTISGVPADATLTAGSRGDDGTWTLGSDDLADLKLNPPVDSNVDFTLTVTATSTESDGGATATSTGEIYVDLEGVADAPTLSASLTGGTVSGGTDDGQGSTGDTGHGSHHGSSWSGSGHGSGEGLEPGGTYADAVDDLEPVAFWQFADNGRTVNDSAGDLDGRYRKGANAEAVEEGVSGAVADFDGRNDRIEIPHDDALEMDSGTIVLWFNTDDADHKQGLFSKDSSGYDEGGHLSGFVDDGQVEVRLQSGNNSYWVKGGDVSSGGWHQMAFSFGPTGMALYLDGEEVDTDNYTGGLGGNEEPLVLGANAWASGDEKANNLRDFFKGQMDDVAVFDRALTPTEIANLHSTGVSVIEGEDGEPRVVVYDLEITGALTDADGSEELTYEVRNVPEGATLSAGTDAGDGTWSLTEGDLENLSLTVPESVGENFTIEVAAISTENDGDEAETVTEIDVDIEAAFTEGLDLTGTGAGETLSGDAGLDTLAGEGGDDQLFGLGGDDQLLGGAGQDSLFGEAGDDVMRGEDGDDKLFGGAGDDVLEGGQGQDTLEGGAGDDTLEGGDGDDRLYGGADDDRLEGGEGNDDLEGGDGFDVLIGGAGDDDLEGGAGDDILTGGEGNDTFIFDAQSGRDVIDDIMNGDRIVFEGQEFKADDLIFNEDDDGNVVVAFNGVEGSEVTLEGVRMEDLDRNQDGDISDGYSVSQSGDQVTITLNTEE